MGPNKRKEAPASGNENKGAKRSKGGPGQGKWQTPSHKAKVEAHRGHGQIESGDVGIWATCARGQEGRATTELTSLLYQYAEQFYGIVPETNEKEDEDGDIETAIRKEAASMNNKDREAKMFSPVRIDIECVLFYKVRPPIDPVDFVHRICSDIVSKSGKKLTRYINRLSPMTLMGKATEKGLEEVANTVLSHHFRLSGKDTSALKSKEDNESDNNAMQKNHSYAIRPFIRNHTKPLARDVVIKQIASSIDDVHKVSLTKPDKVIIVEIYQTICGISVVDGDWETLKRYNLAELYQPTPKVEAMQESAIKEDPSATADRATDSVDLK